jgi:hypothetical protein
VKGTPSASLWNALIFPLIFAGVLAAISFSGRAQENAVVALSLQGSAAAVIVLTLALWGWLRSTGATRSVEFTGAKPQHYIQAMVQLSIFLYWGWYWRLTDGTRPVYHMALLIVAQLAFAYAIDALVSLWRREKYIFGFGPFPIIFSINLFLWFRDDWFYLQFVMIAVGVLGKELIRWERDGRKVHIFNPSAFALGIFSFLLVVTGTTSRTWGPEIASTLRLAPFIYLYLFLGGLVVMYFFRITLLTMTATATLFALGGIYYAVTGVPYFLDTNIPTAVFLGLHLLITDPSTSPRTPTGKIVFGVLYGVSVFSLYTILSATGSPTFYDKLLAVPLLNLSVRWIDRMVAAMPVTPLRKKLGLEALAHRSNLAHMSVWILFFAGMSLWGKTDGRHTGDSLPFWQEACSADKPTACRRLLLLENTYCTDNAGWACNEVGRHYTEGRITGANEELAMAFYSRACELRFQAGCLNILDPGSVTAPNPRAFDLRLLLREGGLNLLDMPEPELYTRACEHGWTFACERFAGVTP